ncbi:F1F0 ATP synthase subunit e, mitochondrial [Elasticomyces elasticus]|nr:F1F0 ATP synthase subunit e, mitochondrial [Elasticomyces elasticus]KAK4965602.1 hypothetical protein LTR28_003425 [Elasticomyces elasticus]KAK4993509.1 F1F0 ATP synthase subunit e, mitochondrial [Elasticomyces elasticus]KAK4998547.1 F1F0 ATP synthase subunit e, mitochondrial [Elasticomyces elasticus]
MTSTGVNVLRWSALGFGALYGLYHQSAIDSAEKMAAATREYEHKSELINKAKAAYVKKNMPQDSKTEGGDIITDPMDPKFDLEAYLTMKTAGEK